MRNQLFVFLLLSVLFAACETSKVASNPAPKTAGIRFQKSETFFDVLGKAEAQGKLVFIDFYIDNCLPCKEMEKNVFTNPEVAAYMNERFINYKVDAKSSNGIGLAGMYGVQYFPTLVFADASGKMLNKKEGGTSQNRFLETARTAAALSSQQVVVR